MNENIRIDQFPEELRKQLEAQSSVPPYPEYNEMLPTPVVNDIPVTAHTNGVQLMCAILTTISQVEDGISFLGGTK